ncbi:hypothetical protein EU803_03115 [Loktanella sp. IMCC34160]|uniref:hypothetical protein n=1 Tax=Loktanella sp. IMCC34160 TaxID=2510646 RepID=UPI00101DC631|nr:hypothetical protein [Loktanella sp. IMCC34160]RYG93109.1 hypothetical protein EU803_03115 [Loktanella sp. IMCC34160]
MQPDTGLEPDPTSADLLLHDGLMSAKLAERFGAMIARPSVQVDEGDWIMRRSSLYQVASDAKVLDATLRISKRNLPDALLTELFESQALLGDLLRRFGINVELRNRTIYKVEESGGHLRWGRRHIMRSPGTELVLCEVDELLDCAANLDKLLLDQAQKT